MNQDLFQGGEVNLYVLFKCLWGKKWFILSATLLVTLSAFFYIKSLPNIYQSEVLLSPVSDSASMQMPSRLGGLAALAGVNLNQGTMDKSAVALEVLKSHKFLGDVIEKYDMLVPLMGVQGWNVKLDKPIFNLEMYDPVAKEWVREPTALRATKPSLLEGYAVLRELMEVNQDKVTGMITITMQYYSPKIAKSWLDLLVEEVNQYMRQLDIEEAKGSIAYLRSKIAATDVAEIQAVMYSLIEEQTKTLMLANLREEYVLKTIDPAIVPEDKIKPRRGLLIIIVCFLAGGFFSFFAILYDVLKIKKDTY